MYRGGLLLQFAFETPFQQVLLAGRERAFCIYNAANHFFTVLNAYDPELQSFDRYLEWNGSICAEEFTLGKLWLITYSFACMLQITFIYTSPLWCTIVNSMCTLTIHQHASIENAQPKNQPLKLASAAQIAGNSVIYVCTLPSRGHENLESKARQQPTKREDKEKQK